ncbi:MAG: hypothetical protein H9533_21935 [Rhodobacteraceae bacterium]|nr:hypothetical protein [Paracoccaceae bacterium]
MSTADLGPKPPPQPLSARQTWAVLGGLKRGCAANGVVRAIDVTRAIRDLRPDLPQVSRVAAIHIGLLPFLFAGQTKYARLRHEIITARASLLSQGFTHVLITGPFVFEANRPGRLKVLYAFQNHGWYAIPFHWLYHIVISACLLLPLGLSNLRRSNLQPKLTNARRGFRQSIVFELQRGPPKP